MDLFDTQQRIVMSNALVSAAYRLSEWEHKIIGAAAVQIPPGTAISTEKMFRVELSDVRDLFDVDRRKVKQLVQDAADRLYERSIRVRYSPDGTKHESVLDTRWLAAKCVVEEGVLLLQFAPMVIPYLSDLSERFTQINLREIGRLSGSWAPRLYQILMQWSSVGYCSIEVDEMRQMLDLNQSEYGRTAELNRRVIMPAVREIQAQIPHLELDLKLKKQGRFIHSYQFGFKSRKHLMEEAKAADQAVLENNTPAKRKSSPIPESNQEKKAKLRAKLRDIGDLDW